MDGRGDGGLRALEGVVARIRRQGSRDLLAGAVAEVAVLDDQGADWLEDAPNVRRVLEAFKDSSGDAGRAADVLQGRDDAEGVNLYDPEEVRAILGDDGFLSDPDEVEPEPRSRIRVPHLGRGPFRRLARGNAAIAMAVEALGRDAPHMAETTAMVVRRVMASAVSGTALRLPPTVLVGEPGIGKTWYLSRLCRMLGVAFREFSMSGSTLSESLQGSHPGWRNAGPGIVAGALLREHHANLMVYVDEIDKGAPGPNNPNPHRPFLALLEPENAKAFQDEYFGFRMRADHVMWMASANDMDDVPEPVRSRLREVQVPRPTPAQARTVAGSVYRDLNVERWGEHFDPEPSADLLDVLSGMPPREARKDLDEAMAAAAADRRDAVRVGDLPAAAPSKARMGFIR